MQSKPSPNRYADKQSAFTVALLCCLPIGCLLTYLFTLGVTDMEGARGYAMIYLILPSILVAFLCIYFFRSKLFHYIIIFISLLLLLFTIGMFYKESYMNQNCLSHHLKRLQEPEKSAREASCARLRSLPRW